MKLTSSPLNAIPYYTITITTTITNYNYTYTIVVTVVFGDARVCWDLTQERFLPTTYWKKRKRKWEGIK